MKIIKSDFEDKVLKLLGFSSRMGSLIYGKEKITAYLYTKNAHYMLFLSSDCSENTRKFWLDKANSLESEIYIFEETTKLELAKRLGKIELSVVATDNVDILNGIRKILKNNLCLDT